MLSVKVNDGESFEVDMKTREMLINGKPVAADWVVAGHGKYHVIVKDRSYNVEIGPRGDDGKNVTVYVNGAKHVAALTSELDALLHKLGMDKMAGGKINEIKAPMPGLVLRLMVEEGQPVQKGDALLVLEAMKMENVIKAAGDAVVKKIQVSTRMAVDKNQVLMVME